MKYRYLFIFIALLLVGLITNRLSHPDSANSERVSIIIDSVFINQYQEIANYGPIYVYSFFTINSSADSLLFQTHRRLSPKEKTRCYGLYYGDTIPLSKRNDFIIKPNQSTSKTFLLGEEIPPPPNHLSLYDSLFEKHSPKFYSKLELIEDIIVNSSYVFDFGNWKYTIKQSNRDSIKIKYLRPPQEGYTECHTWPIP